MVFMIVQSMLADARCESVTNASTVNQAIELISAQPFDAAMLDVNIQGSNSYAVADVLISRAVPFFFATGYDDSGVSDEYRKYPFLSKPFRRQEFLDMFTRLFPA